VSRRRWLTSVQVKKLQKAWKLQSPDPFIGGGERERDVVVPHIGDKAPASSQNNCTMAHDSFLYSRKLIGGPRSGFEWWRESELVWATLFTDTAHSLVFHIFPKLN
jgi:hypothetical protein